MYYVISEIQGELFVMAELPFHALAEHTVTVLRKMYPYAIHSIQSDSADFQVREFVKLYREIDPIKTEGT